ncbi:MAG: segregation/condensation protein A [Nanoarchaeota archaeon]|nr:segregation/condensation protein A [Nanoarchaeota archaeon]MBU1051260.1 segregation/condensation protein A [Nanoarchaeota archaeon]MBU1988620.1 segregation/condensation protein A [Nanoarchaeota archaeon]
MTMPQQTEKIKNKEQIPNPHYTPQQADSVLRSGSRRNLSNSHLDATSYSRSNPNENKKVSQEQIHGLLFGEQLSWQAIILDLINSEQLDPWDIDLTLLTNKYLEKIKDIEEANLFVSSKVLFAAALLLRIKSEILLNQDLPGLDDILFGKKEEKKYVQERIELEDEIPELMQRTPLPRYKKVTLQELLSALGKALRTENRRIKKVVTARQQEIETAIAIPKAGINIRDKIKEVYNKLRGFFTEKEERVAFSELVGENGNGEEKVSTFVPLLHLDNQHKVFLEQEKHLEEIYVWIKSHYMKANKSELEQMRKEAEIENVKAALEQEQERSEKAEKVKEEREKKTIKNKSK